MIFNQYLHSRTKMHTPISYLLVYDFWNREESLIFWLTVKTSQLLLLHKSTPTCVKYIFFLKTLQWCYCDVYIAIRERETAEIRLQVKLYATCSISCKEKNVIKYDQTDEWNGINWLFGSISMSLSYTTQLGVGDTCTIMTFKTSKFNILYNDNVLLPKMQWI